MRFLVAIVLVLVGCRSSGEDSSLMDSCQSPIVGFVVPLSKDGRMLLWVRQIDFSGHGVLAVSVVKFIDGRWIGCAPVRPGRGFSAQALRSNCALNLQMKARGEVDCTHDILVAIDSDARCGFMLASKTLVKVVQADDFPGGFMIMAYVLTKFGDQTMVVAVNSDVLSFENGRFVPEL